MSFNICLLAHITVLSQEFSFNKLGVLNFLVLLKLLIAFNVLALVLSALNHIGLTVIELVLLTFN